MDTDSQVNASLFTYLLMEVARAQDSSKTSLQLTQDQLYTNFELFGYKLGLRLNELQLFKLDYPNFNFTAILDIMKFICKDFWKVLFNKQISNLRTNHRGTFVLIDTNFKLIECLNTDSPDFAGVTSQYLYFVCGIIKGILKNFGIDSVVTYELQFPQVSFNIETEFNN